MLEFALKYYKSVSEENLSDLLPETEAMVHFCWVTVIPTLCTLIMLLYT